MDRAHGGVRPRVGGAAVRRPAAVPDSAAAEAGSEAVHAANTASGARTHQPAKQRWQLRLLVPVASRAVLPQRHSCCCSCCLPACCTAAAASAPSQLLHLHLSSVLSRLRACTGRRVPPSARLPFSCSQPLLAMPLQLWLQLWLLEVAARVSTHRCARPGAPPCPPRRAPPWRRSARAWSPGPGSAAGGWCRARPRSGSPPSRTRPRRRPAGAGGRQQAAGGQAEGGGRRAKQRWKQARPSGGCCRSRWRQ